jgi:hypothetical protein
MSRALSVAAAFVLIVCQQECHESFAPEQYAITKMRALRARLEQYRESHGSYPTTQQGLHVLGDIPKDSWANDFIYRSPGIRHTDAYDLFSAGPDRREGTADDFWGE